MTNANRPRPEEARPEPVCETMPSLADLLAGLDPIRLGVALVQLAETEPESAHVLAVRLAVELMGLRAQWRHDQVESARAVQAELRRQGFTASRWVPFEELQRRRAQPGPMAGGAA